MGPLGVSCGVWHPDVGIGSFGLCGFGVGLCGSGSFVSIRLMLNRIENLEAGSVFFGVPRAIPGKFLRYGGVHYPAGEATTIEEYRSLEWVVLGLQQCLGGWHSTYCSVNRMNTRTQGLQWNE